MPPKTKRTVREREDETLDGSSPAKRLRTEDTHSGTTEHQNGVALPAQVEEPLEQDEQDEDEEQEEATEVAPTPILDDLYLETVRVIPGLR